MKNYSRKFVLALIDIVQFNIALLGSLLLIFEGNIPVPYLNIYLHSCILVTALYIISYYVFGLYKSLWQYASINELIKVFLSVSLATAVSLVFSDFINMRYPISVYMMTWLLTLLVVGGNRMSYRVFRKIKNYRIMKNEESGYSRVMVIGAGIAGCMVIKEFKNHPELGCKAVVLIDDDKTKHRSNIFGVSVMGGRGQIKTLAKTCRVDEIILAIPSASRKTVSEILEICKQTNCKLRTLPGMYEILGDMVSIKSIRDVYIEDLLGREEVKLNSEVISSYLKGEVVLVTGGGGSIGSELCRQIAKFQPKRLIILDNYENNAYDLQNELIRTHGDRLNLEVVIASVREKERLREVFKKYKPGVVFHAAAHKHVPLMEANPAEAVKNNIFGTQNTAQCADEFGAKRFVMISTDKAVNPTNVMGATKRVAEMIIQSLDRHSKTEFVAVRFGNVLGSNGSVIPLFKKQIEAGGPVTVTHPEITRFFMTIPEAARLVIQAGAMAEGGEIFILDMGESVKIVNLAEDLIKLSGFEPYTDIDIKFTGLRPGEKLYEELLLDEEGILKTSHEKIFVGKPVRVSFHEMILQLKALENSLSDNEGIRECLGRIVGTYKPEEKRVSGEG